jgi:O-antigen/teichoic acid export membrane protein
MTLGGALSFARLLSGLVRVKVLALAIGVTGVGIFSLLAQVNLTATGLVSMSLAVPIINLGRPLIQNRKAAEAGVVAGTALALVTTNAIILVALAALFRNQAFAALGLGSLDPMLVWPLLLSIVIAGYSTTFWEGMSFVADRFDAYVKVGIAAAFVDMIATAAAAWFYGLRGAILVMPIGSLTFLGAYALLLARDPIVRQVLRNLSVSVRQLAPLLTYSAMMFGTVWLTNAGLTFTRAKVLVEAGTDANGYLQVVTSISAYMLAFVTTGFWGHLHPRASAAGDTKEVRGELDQALRLGLLMAFTGCGLAVALADYLVPLFYSGQFGPSVQLLIAYMPGELCYQLLFLLTAYQLTISRRRRYLTWSLGYIGLLTLVALVAIPRFGAAGYVGGHIIASVTMLIVTGLICWRTGQVRGSFLALAAALAVAMATVSAGLLYLHAQGAPKALSLIGLIPFAVTGLIVLRQLLRGTRFGRRLAPHELDSELI